MKVKDLQNDDGRVYYFDVLHTADGHDIYWLYSRGPKEYKMINGTKYSTTAINPEELYVNEYSFYDDCEDIVKQGKVWVNFSVPQDYIDEWMEAKCYPFKEGDTYYTIEESMDSNLRYEVVESCWDDVSEEIHDEYGDDLLYFSREEEAKEYLSKCTTWPLDGALHINQPKKDRA
ncbi:MAG: hypothetical protein CL833_16155 [Crocinitomicaceae bacterium]|nr:hypothetical protein [Crocinitomicaceae bacterium]